MIKTNVFIIWPIETQKNAHNMNLGLLELMASLWSKRGYIIYFNEQFIVYQPYEKSWYFNNIKHRIGGPAYVENSDGHDVVQWIKNGYC